MERMRGEWGWGLLVIAAGVAWYLVMQEWPWW